MQTFIEWLMRLADQVPVTWFVAIGALVEEIIAPIPSPLVMTLAGSITISQNMGVSFLFWLAAVGAVTKTIGSYVIYFIADKAEDLVTTKFGKFLGVSSSDTEGIGKLLGKGKRDKLTIFLMRAVPIMPTAPVSVIAGLIKTDLKTYLTSTFFGLVIRNMIYLYLGYTSLGTLESAVEGFDSLEKIGYLILGIAFIAVLVWMYRKRQKGNVLETIDSLVKKLKGR